MPERLPPLYPLRFKEIYKDKIWGGPELAKIMAKKGAGKKCGESWEIVQRGKETSVVANGPLKGWSLERLSRSSARRSWATSSRCASAASPC